MPLWRKRQCWPHTTLVPDASQWYKYSAETDRFQTALGDSTNAAKSLNAYRPAALRSTMPRLPGSGALSARSADAGLYLAGSAAHARRHAGHDRRAMD